MRQGAGQSVDGTISLGSDQGDVAAVSETNLFETPRSTGESPGYSSLSAGAKARGF